MTQVSFYIIPENEPQAHFQFACKIVEKAYQRGHRVFIQCTDLNEVHIMDELLWTFNDESFIPHNIVGEGPYSPPPIQLSHEHEPPANCDILLNLASHVPPFHQRFNRIIEIVSQYPAIKQYTREHYKFYREQTYNLKMHDLTSA